MAGGVALQNTMTTATKPDASVRPGRKGPTRVVSNGKC